MAGAECRSIVAARIVDVNKDRWTATGRFSGARMMNGLLNAAAMMTALAGPSAPPEAPVHGQEPELVVTGERHGQARVEADREMGEAQISTFGAESIEQLLERAKAWIEPFGDPPLLLINGKPIGYDRSILSYPAEALSRLEVLKEEARAEYGHGGTGRVVNLVLKRRFSQFSLDLGYDQPTAGGASGQRLSATRTAIHGEMRWNASARIQRDTALMKNKRGGQRLAGFFPDQAAVQGLDGAELDPALSDRLGRPTSAAALPSGSGPWSVDDFVQGAQLLALVDPSAFESLKPERQSVGLTLGISRPLGDFQLSLNLNANGSRNRSWRGPATAQILWGADHPASPFEQDVALALPIARNPALKVEGENKSIGTSLNVNGKLASWQLGIGLNLNRSWNENRLQVGVDTAALQRDLDAGDWQPWDDVGPDRLRVNATSGRQDMMSGNLNVQRSLWDGPAGPLNLSLSMNGNLAKSHRKADGRDLDAISRRSGSGRATLSVPINRDGEGVLPALGDLSLDLGASRQWATASVAQQSWSAGLNYQPRSWLQLRMAWDQAEMVPSAEQLDGPIDQNVQRVFDYARQEMVEILWITGGNPNLREGRRQNLMISGTLRPWSAISYDVSYRQSVARGGIAGLPELTPIIEAAFRERIERDADGRLTSIDARPINLDHQTDSQLSQNFTFNWPPSSGGGAAENPWRFQASLNHGMRLKSELKIRGGVPVINQLGADSGQSRHNLSGQIGLSRGGMGVTLNGQWSSASRLRVGEDQPDLYFKPPLTINLNSFIELNKISAHPIFKGSRISFDVQNLTREYRRVMLSDGSVPIGYARDDVDPVGRTVKITARKRF